MKEQLHKLMEAEGLSPARFADEIGVQRSSISHIISGRNKPSYDFIMKILDRFKGINAEWLLTGRGNMIKGLESSKIPENQPTDLFSGKGNRSIQKSGNETKEETIYQPPESVGPVQPESDKSAKKSEQETRLNSKFTNVNSVRYLLAFYDDGSFEQFNPRE
ncbi:MAG: helix-turn-helix domain-containing protein [Bacteroidales bacterium]|nr:helix-turn-helix domain-containing protein [Bacteroidales bacterium]